MDAGGSFAPKTRARLPAEVSIAGEDDEAKEVGLVGLVGESSAWVDNEDEAADFVPEKARFSLADGDALGAASVENERRPFGAKASENFSEMAEKFTGGSFGGFENQFLMALPGLEPSDSGSSITTRRNRGTEGFFHSEERDLSE